jgi:hypothetical protein
MVDDRKQNFKETQATLCLSQENQMDVRLGTIEAAITF